MNMKKLKMQRATSHRQQSQSGNLTYGAAGPVPHLAMILLVYIIVAAVRTDLGSLAFPQRLPPHTIQMACTSKGEQTTRPKRQDCPTGGRSVVYTGTGPSGR
jgi:hypothetical protein